MATYTITRNLPNATIQLQYNTYAQGVAIMFTPVPTEAIVTAQHLSGNWVYTGSGSVTKVTAGATSLPNNFSYDVNSYNFFDNSITFTAYPKGKKGGSVALSNLVLTITYTIDTGEPTITLGIPTKTKISSVEGYDQSVVTFSSDKDLQYWEARATLPGATIGHGIGLLVESGTTLSANIEATVIIDDEELTNGDSIYIIAVFGQSVGGVWSEDTEVNLFDTLVVDMEELVTFDNYTLIADTGNVNTVSEDVYYKVQTWKNWDNPIGIFSDTELGSQSIEITVDISTVDMIRLGLNGNNVDGTLWVELTESGTYTLSFTVNELSINRLVLSNLRLVKEG